MGEIMFVKQKHYVCLQYTWYNKKTFEKTLRIQANICKEISPILKLKRSIILHVHLPLSAWKKNCN